MKKIFIAKSEALKMDCFAIRLSKLDEKSLEEMDRLDRKDTSTLKKTVKPMILVTSGAKGL